MLHLSGQHRGLIPDDLVDLTLFQNTSVLGVALAGDAVVEGDHALFETLHNFKVGPAKAQFQDINGKSANINDIRDGVRLQGAVLRDSGSKCLRIAKNLIDANGVVLAIVLKVNGFPPTQKVLLEAAVQLFVMRRRQTNQERDVDGIQSFRYIPILQLLRNRKEGENEETVILGFITKVRDAPLCQRIVLPVPADVVRFESLKPVRYNQAEVKIACGVLMDLLP